MKLGVCYYPEHWPEAQWPEDARRMVEMGISHVRIGEFAWALFEPEPGQYDWDWFDRAIEILHAAGLKLILGTPTATPPKWLVDQMPDMVAVDAEGEPRRFGSRRHYCFSHQGYRAESRRIVTAMAERYGQHPAVVMWQTDNEYGCHNTTISYSEAARQGFRQWLKRWYGVIYMLNREWGNVFWSMNYRDFDEVDLPFQTVTEPNPAHVMDFRRYSSDQVVSFNKEQVVILRRLSPGRQITHNFMGFYSEFDHHGVGQDLDMATWDSYPLGFHDQSPLPDEMKQRWMQQGHPDFASFHHDLYRGCSPKWGVMEQQPGPVNWAPYNPAPLPGMVRLWTHEALAHGADLVSYFRWRQVPFAQEQMHAGLLRPDDLDASAAKEVRQVRDELPAINDQQTAQAPVALIYDYQSQWVHEIQPQGQAFNTTYLTFQWYSVLRQMGVDVDIVSPKAALTGYRLVVIPTLPIMPAQLIKSLQDAGAHILIGPRTGGKTPYMTIPRELPPGPLQSVLPFKVVRVESIRQPFTFPVTIGAQQFEAELWREEIETDMASLATYEDGSPAILSKDGWTYVSCWPGEHLLSVMMHQQLEAARIEVRSTGPDIRLRSFGHLQFAFNYGTTETDLTKVGAPTDESRFVIGTALLKAAGVAAWRKT